KRLRKLQGLRIRDAVKADAPHEEPDLLLIGMGSSSGTIDEVRSRLAAEGVRTNRLFIRQVHPFPAELVRPHLAKARKVVVIENNATGQLAAIIKTHIGEHHDKIHSMLKYDGTPFLPHEVEKGCKELI